MRIIAGEWRGRKLVAPPGDLTRPTADRTRETLFNMLASRIGSFEGLAVLDLFAGSGALGLEALSRGAASCLFVEQDVKVAKTRPCHMPVEILRFEIECYGIGQRAIERAHQASFRVIANVCHLICPFMFVEFTTLTPNVDLGFSIIGGGCDRFIR